MTVMACYFLVFDYTVIWSGLIEIPIVSTTRRPDFMLLRFLLLALCLLMLPAAGAMATVDLEREREQFKTAYRALKKGDRKTAATLRPNLAHYPLVQYLDYERLRRDLHRASVTEVRDFLQAHDGSYLAERLRRQWLLKLAERAAWDDYLSDYRPQIDPALRCYQLTARLATKQHAHLARDAKDLWLVGKSQPDACDRVFTYLRTTPLFDDQLVWARMELALGERKQGFARYLARQLSSTEAKTWAKHLVDAYAKPQGTLNQMRYNVDAPYARRVTLFALERLARVKLDQAISTWDQWQREANFEAGEKSRIDSAIAVAAARADDPRQLDLLDRVDNRLAGDRVESYRLRAGIEAQAWEQLARWTAAPPNGDSNPLEWSYWHARSLQLINREEESTPVFRRLADERDYYGYLSADRLGLPYRFNYVPIRATPGAYQSVAERPGFKRTAELLALDMVLEARREWAHEIERLDKGDQEIAARIAADWQWHDRAIATLGRAKSYDDIEIRFPVLHLDLVRDYAKRRRLDNATVYSIIRTESAFARDARSPAGALGLMQLMPATGRETARRVGVRISRNADLLDPGRNISLGTAYLAGLMQRYDNNFPMAAAAYNAGPHRVKQWRPRSGCVPSDIWIDSIPFRETRGYVKRTLFYQAVYQHRLEEPIKPLSESMQGIPAAGFSRGCVDPLNRVASVNTPAP